METVPSVAETKWRDFISDSPYNEVSLDEPIALHRLGYHPWDNPVIRRLRELPAEMNVAGLSWRRL